MPERQGGGGDSKWNYALLVPMLGLAAFRWIWSKQSQKEINDAKIKIQKNLHLKLQALASEKEKLMKENSDIKLECDDLKDKISRFHEALKKGKEQNQEAEVLGHVENWLEERQDFFCSNVLHHSRRERMEKNLLVYVAKQPLLAHLEMKNDLSDIFKNDRSCAEYLNADLKKNGCLMYLRYWKVQLALQQHKRAEAAILGIQTKK
ncbi:Coiled-coil domain-containing protein 127 [Anabarilius grahami]|uniref:Coiled-coil domain-containing protein 127 n=1 Tax=Anabarilius grahami TaxID=495550 RepID=A0A3N0YGR0_ANAGA|nr:Coiled-coil domain-containing protein 127 [Anabarilius grahami]